MSAQPPSADHAEPVTFANYDQDDYDYRQFWTARDYEHWAEAHVLRRLLDRVSHVDWLIDLGGGFGRHVPLYQRYASHVVLLDYSWTNLKNAEAVLLPNGPGDGSLFLVRGNLYHLPFRTGAIDMGATTRVIHHLRAIDDALAEMGRPLRAHWILDVPIKHHLLARLRALPRRQFAALRDRRPNEIGTPDTPFLNFHLGAIRERLSALGWSSSIAASVNNLRRWERVLPGPLVAPARPIVNTIELAAQRLGRGWWGPAQFLWLTRQDPPAPLAESEAPADLPAPWNLLASRMMCPACQGELAWSPDAARCLGCGNTYLRTGAIWDFVAG